MLLPDPHRPAPGLPGDVDVQSGAGADDHVRFEAAQMLGDTAVGELAVLGVAALGGGEHLGGPPVRRVGALVAGAVLPEVHQMPQRDPGAEAEDRGVAVAQYGDDLDVVPLGERMGQVERGADRPPDPVRVV